MGTQASIDDVRQAVRAELAALHAPAAADNDAIRAAELRGMQRILRLIVTRGRVDYPTIIGMVRQSIEAAADDSAVVSR
jgi:hypothetical protein